MDWHIKIKVCTPFGTIDDVNLEDCIKVYQKPYDSNYYLERANGVDGIIDYDSVQIVYANKPEIVDGEIIREIYWEENSDRLLQEGLEAILRSMEDRVEEEQAEGD